MQRCYALGFQHFPRDLANVNEWKIMFDPYSTISFYFDIWMMFGQGLNTHIPSVIHLVYKFQSTSRSQAAIISKNSLLSHFPM